MFRFRRASAGLKTPRTNRLHALSRQAVSVGGHRVRLFKDAVRTLPHPTASRNQSREPSPARLPIFAEATPDGILT